MATQRPQGKLFYGWVVVGALFMTNFAVQATGTLNFGLFVLPMSADLGISRSLIGWVQTGRFLAGGASSFFVGRLLDRFGPRVLVAVAAIIAGAALWGLGHIDHAWQFFLLFALVGATGLSAPGGVLTSVPVAKWFVRRRGLAMSLATLGLGVGAFAFMPVTQTLISHFGWRTAWVALGAISVGIAAPLALLFLRRQPEDMGLAPDGDSPASASPSAAASASPSGLVVTERSWTLAEALHTRAFWRLSLAFVIMAFAQGGASVHRVPYWVEERGFAESLVSWSFTVDAIASASMMLLTGLLVSRIPTRFVAVGGCLVWALSIGLMIVGSNSYYLFASTSIFGLAVGTAMLTQAYILAEYYGRGFQGAIRGVVLILTMIASGAGAPFNGYIYDIIGSYIPSWWIFLGMYLVAAAILFTAAPPKPVSPSHSPLSPSHADR
ncbi:MAG: MFS transporter [Chloroflexota bacterium]|nr:MFS transporter [Chloroflexota bacterium]